MVLTADVAAGDDGTIDQYNNMRKDIFRGYKVLHTQTYASTTTFDLDNSNIQTTTLTGNPTLAVSHPVVGQAFFIRLVQGGTGSNTVTWWSGIKWPGATAPSLSTAVGAIDAFMFICTGTGTYDGYFAGFGLS